MDKYRNLYLDTPGDQAGGSEAAETKATETTETKAAEAKATETTETKATETKATETKATETKATETKATETAEAKAPDPALIRAELRAAAAEAGVPAAKIAHVIKLAEVTGADKPGADLSALAKAAVEAVLNDVPEFNGAGTGSMGDFRRQAPTAAEDAARKEFAKYL
jgi:hypothetical protein